MAELFREPFEGLGRWYWSQGQPTFPPTIVAGRNGNCVRLSSCAIATLISPTSVAATLTAGFALRVSSLTTQREFASTWADSLATVHNRLRVETTGAISITRGSTVLGTSATGVIAINTWYYVEVALTLSATTGTVEVKVNGADVIGPLTNQNTKNGGTQTVYSILQVGAGGGNIDIDDLYLRNDLTFNGDIGAVAAPPSQERVYRESARVLLANTPVDGVSAVRNYRTSLRVLESNVNLVGSGVATMSFGATASGVLTTPAPVTTNIGLWEHDAGSWHPTVSGRLNYIRMGGVWNPCLDMWIRDQGAWHKIASYSAPQLAPPANLRMNTADPNNHSTIPVAWDWNQPTNGLPVGNFHIVLTDEAGNWLREMFPTAAQRTWTFSNVTPNKRYRVYIAAQYPGGGRPDTPFVGPLNWFVGQDAYVVNDVPLYGWGATEEYIPPYYYNFTSAANGDNGTWGFQKAIDNNFSSYWNTDLMSGAPPTANDGEGWMVQPPGDNAQLVGVRYWFIYPHTLWVGVWINNAWQGGLNPYTGKYSGWVHPYVNANYGGPFTQGDISVGPYDCRGTTAFVAGLQQVAYYDGYNYRMEAIEIRLLVQRWIQTGWGPRTVPAISSGSY